MQALPKIPKSQKKDFYAQLQVAFDLSNLYHSHYIAEVWRFVDSDTCLDLYYGLCILIVFFFLKSKTSSNKTDRLIVFYCLTVGQRFISIVCENKLP